MTWMDAYDPAALRRDTEKAMSLPLGLTNPLWLAFGAVASVGVAWWWMSRLGRPFNVEAFAGAAPEVTAPKVTAPKVTAPRAAAPPPPAREIPAPQPVARAEPVVEAVAAAVAPEPDVSPAAAAVADDFTRLAGIGPRIAAALAERGMTRFAELAAWSADDLAAFDAELNLRGRALRGAWIDQARALAAETA